MSKKYNSDKIKEEVEKILYKYNISAVLKIPNCNVMSVIRSEGDELELHDWFEVEKMIKQKLRKEEIEQLVTMEMRDSTKRFNIKNKFIPKYLQ